MAKDKGYILLFRDIQNNVIWKADTFSKGQAWVDLLLMANHEAKTFILGNEVIQAEAGSVITSELKLMDRWKWSKEKVRNFLRVLENLEMIERRPDKKKTVIIIKNYVAYQTAYRKKDSQESPKNQTTEQTTENSLFMKDNKEDQTTEQTTNRPQADHKQTTDHTQTINYKNTINALQSHYGIYENVLLSDEEMKKLKDEFSEYVVMKKIDDLSVYMESTGKSYKSHYATIREWIRKDRKEESEAEKESSDKFDELTARWEEILDKEGGG